MFEKAKSVVQQRLMGMAYSCKKYGENCEDEDILKLAKNMKLSSLKKFASTKHKGLPYKVGEDLALLGNTIGIGSINPPTAEPGSGDKFDNTNDEEMNLKTIKKRKIKSFSEIVSKNKKKNDG